MNHNSAENFMRSANAPQISAGVMIAKVIWKTMNTVSGMVSAAAASRPSPSVNGLSQPMPSRNRRERSPMTVPPLPKASE